jgi:hypothetical protein
VSNDDGRAARSAAWGVFALFCGAVVAIWISVSEHHVTPLVWVGACAIGLVAVAGLYMSFATLNRWPPANRSRRRSELPWGESPLGRYLGTGDGALSAPLPNNGPLQVTLEQEKWDDWQHLVWIAEFRFTITNTSGQPITLERFDLASDPGDGERPSLDQVQANALKREIQRRRDEHGHSNLRRTELNDGESVSGWWVQDAYLPFPAKVGRPRCEFTVVDGVGDAYKLDIPARAPQIRRINPGA